MKFDSIIFDLDGTLWDSTKNVTISWNDTFEKMGLSYRITPDDLTRSMGMTMYAIAEKLFTFCDKKEAHELMDMLCITEREYLSIHGGKLYGGVVETLSELRKTHRLFIVSNCQLGYIETFLDAHKLYDYFEATDCWGRTLVHKGETNRMLIERNGLKSPVYVGDTQGDYESAVYAKIPFVWARYGFGKPSGYNYVIDRFSQLLDIVKD